MTAATAGQSREASMNIRLSYISPRLFVYACISEDGLSEIGSQSRKRAPN